MKNKSRNKMEIFQKICAAQRIGVIDKDILDIAITEKLKLQEKGFSIQDDDLLIAAYCLKHKFTLVTNNTKHFKNIENLEIIKVLL
jgi:tRNA(fMet)-specific endonuclease VapC